MLRENASLVAVCAGFGLFAAVGAWFVGSMILGERNEKSQIARLDIEDLESELRSFRRACGRYPIASEGLAVLLSGPLDCSGRSRSLSERATLVDPWGNTYKYAPPETPTSGPVLRSLGKDGIANTADDIVVRVVDPDLK